MQAELLAALSNRRGASLRSLAVNSSTACLVQGLGRKSQIHSKLNMTLGTNIVGGVDPVARSLSFLGKPTFTSVKEAVDKVKPTATTLFVAPLAVREAILESLEAEIPLIVCVTRGVSIVDQLAIMAALHSQSSSRLVGPDSGALVNSRGGSLGFAPSIELTPGPVGIAGQSGSLAYEAAVSCQHLGQSYILGLGGDFYPGTRTAEALAFLMDDDSTEGIILVGEVGGTMEEEVADFLRSPSGYRDPETGLPRKPIVGFIAGHTVPPGKIFGRGGACWRDGAGSADSKRQAWQEAGIRVVDTIHETGAAIEEEMRERGLLREVRLQSAVKSKAREKSTTGSLMQKHFSPQPTPLGKR